MKTLKLLAFEALGIGLLATVLSCRSNPSPRTNTAALMMPAAASLLDASPAETDVRAVTNLALILHLEQGNFGFVVKSGPDGRRYSGRDDKGNVLCRDVTEQGLEATRPELYRAIKLVVDQAMTDYATKPEVRVWPLYHSTTPAPESEVRVSSPPDPNASSPEVVGDLPVIAYLERRNQTITIKAGPNGAVYTVTDRQGKVLHRDVSDRELQAKAPDLFQFVKTAMGQGGGVKANDASLRINPTR